MFEKVKDMYKLQKQAKSIRKELKNLHIQAEADDLVTVTVSAEFEIIEIALTEKAVQGLKDGSISKKEVDDALKKALNKALKKAQEVSSEKTKGVFQDLGIG
jgi:DNA-binding protein YbaB